MATYSVLRAELPTPFPVGPVNAYAVKSNEGWILVDTGPKYAPTKEALDAFLTNAGLAGSLPDAVVLTHGHVDHVGYAGYFQSQGVPVYAHPGASTWLEPGGTWDNYRQSFFRALYHQMGVPEELITQALHGMFLMQKWNDRSVVDRPLIPGTSFDWWPDFSVLHVPGHAQAAIALWNARTGDILVGDQLLPDISSNAFVEPDMHAERGEDAKRTRSLLQYRESMTELAALPIRTVYPGHGEPFSEVKDLVSSRLQSQEGRREQFYDLVATTPGLTTFQLATTYFPRHLNQLPLILSESIGYLDWLQENGRVRTVVDDKGRDLWMTV